MKFIRGFNQVILFILLCIGIVEFVAHGASWDGVFLAIHKHQASAAYLYARGE